MSISFLNPIRMSTSLLLTLCCGDVLEVIASSLPYVDLCHLCATCRVCRLATLPARQPLLPVVIAANASAARLHAIHTQRRLRWSRVVSIPDDIYLEVD